MRPYRAHVEVVSPLPVGWLPQVWAWLWQWPDRNLDDLGPRTFDAFLVACAAHGRAGEQTWGVTADDAPSGAVWFRPETPRLGALHFCFSDHVWGHGVSDTALARVTAALYATGVEKIVVALFADNRRCGAFLARLGAVDEGWFRAHTLREGRPTDMRVMALFAPGVL